MFTKAVCTGCGRTIQSDFLYCPWCGYSRVSCEEESLDVLFNRFKENRKDKRRKQLDELEKQLDDLKQELDVLVLSAEMHK